MEREEATFVNPQTVMNAYKGRTEQPEMLHKVFRQENAKYRQLLEIGDVVLGAVLRYERTERYLGEYMKTNYDVEDMPFRAIDNEFVRNFHIFLKVNKKAEQNIANKYCKDLKKIVRLALDNNWMEANPFQGIKFSAKATTRDNRTGWQLCHLYFSGFDAIRDNRIITGSC